MPQISNTLLSWPDADSEDRRFELHALQSGLVVPLPAWDLVLECEDRGICLSVTGFPGAYTVHAEGPITEAIRERLRRWKLHVVLLLSYQPSDAHLRDSSVPFPEHGPIVSIRRDH